MGKLPLTFIHGPGPGVTSFANWRLVFPAIGEHYRALWPDMVGFGFIERPAGIEKTLLVGNLLGDAWSLVVAIRAPEHFQRLVLMGVAGTSFALTQGWISPDVLRPHWKA